MEAYLSCVVAMLLTLSGSAFGPVMGFHKRTKTANPKNSVTVITVETGLPQCHVDIDGSRLGVTVGNGRISIGDVQPGEHYLHVRCPGRAGADRFISLRRGEQVQIKTAPLAAEPTAASVSPPDRAAVRTRLRRLVLQAVQLRNNGEFGEAVKLLREATTLDPRNADLHRELGITFLMTHEWERARIEMLEAIYHDPSDADAHSGLAYALDKLGNLDGALKEYRICTHLDPGDSSYQRHYVEVLTEQAAQKAARKH